MSCEKPFQKPVAGTRTLDRGRRGSVRQRVWKPFLKWRRRVSRPAGVDGFDDRWRAMTGIEIACPGCG